MSNCQKHGVSKVTLKTYQVENKRSTRARFTTTCRAVCTHTRCRTGRFPWGMRPRTRRRISPALRCPSSARLALHTDRQICNSLALGERSSSDVFFGQGRFVVFLDNRHQVRRTWHRSKPQDLGPQSTFPRATCRQELSVP
jgi:hypothetical protein